MTNPITVNYDVETGELTEREMTVSELKEYQKQCTKIDEAKAETLAKIQLKNEVLLRLGITAEEAKLLLS